MLHYQCRPSTDSLSALCKALETVITPDDANEQRRAHIRAQAILIFLLKFRGLAVPNALAARYRELLVRGDVHANALAYVKLTMDSPDPRLAARIFVPLEGISTSAASYSAADWMRLVSLKFDN
jgi:hypothetical protein